MNILLDSLQISLAPDGAEVRYEPRAEISRRYDQTLLSSVTDSRGYVRVWSLRTPEEEVSTVDAISAILRAPGSFEFSGDLLTVSSVRVHARNVVRQVGRNAAYAVLSFELWEDAVLADERKELVRVLVADSTDHLVDLSAWLLRATVSADVESFAKTATVTFWRETQSQSKAPLMGSPRPISPGRRVLIEAAIIGLEEAVEEADWQPIFSGRIDDVGWGGNASQITVPCRDPAGRLHDASIIDESEYGNDIEPTPILEVMQALIDDTLVANPPTIYLGTSVDQGIYRYTQRRQSLQDALFALRDVVGFDLRYRWNASAQEFQLTFYEPDRDKTTPDHTFSTDDYFEITDVSLSALGVRNRVIVDWDVDQASVVVEDTTSIAEYANDESDGVFTVFLDETQNPQINTQAAALALASAVLAETAYPSLTHEAANAFTPEVEIGDLCRYPPNGIHYDSTVDVAVVAYTHEIGPDGNVTTIRGRGSPSGSVTRWYTKEKAAVVKKDVEIIVEEPPPFVSRIQFLYTSSAGGGHSHSSSANQSLGGFFSRTEVVDGMFGIFRAVTEAEAAAGITLYRSIAVVNADPSPTPQDWECVIGFLSPDAGYSGDYEFAVGLDPVGLVYVWDTDPQGGLSEDEETPPDSTPAIQYLSPLELDSGVLNLGTIPKNWGRMIHLRLQVYAGAAGAITNQALVLQDTVCAS